MVSYGFVFWHIFKNDISSEGVYIHLRADTMDAPHELHSSMNEQQTNNTDDFFIISGDFNHVNLKSVLPKFYQHMTSATRGNNTVQCEKNTFNHF